MEGTEQIEVVESVSFGGNGPIANSPLSDGQNLDARTFQSFTQGFAVTDEGSANWLVRKIVEARAYAEHVTKWAEAEKARAVGEEKSLMFLFGRQLEAWAKSQIKCSGGRQKSVLLPAGTVGFRSIQPKIVIDNERLVVTWAKVHCTQAIIVVERISKSVLDRYVEQTGSVPDAGVHVEPHAERFYVK